MEKHPYNDDDLDRYLRDEMDAPEKQAFEQQLANDTTLADDLALQQDTIKGIRLDGSHNLKQQLQAVEAGLAGKEIAANTDKSGIHRRLMAWVAIAASLLTVVLLGYLFLTNASSPEEMYVAYYQPYPNLINPAQRSTEVEEETVLEQAVRAYDGQDYEQALRLFAQGNARSNPGYTFYYAASYLGLDQPNEAIPLFEQVVQDKESLFYEPALWYLALAHLKTGDTTAAVPYLETLSSQGGDYVREARELREEIE